MATNQLFDSTDLLAMFMDKKGMPVTTGLTKTYHNVNCV